MQSKPLPSFPFPQKTVLVLGKERSGIPPQILQVSCSRGAFSIVVSLLCSHRDGQVRGDGEHLLAVSSGPESMHIHLAGARLGPARTLRGMCPMLRQWLHMLNSAGLVCRRWTAAWRFPRAEWCDP